MKESDIRPQDKLKEYLRLASKDANNLFLKAKFNQIKCVACNDDRNDFQFTKNKFEYCLCQNCGTLYQNPRPELLYFEEFYKNSESSSYWENVFFPSVMESRVEKVFKPRVRSVEKLLKKKNIEITSVTEVGAGFGIFLEHFQKIYPKIRFLAIEPSPMMALECKSRGVDVHEDIAENLPDNFPKSDLVVSFEVLEHAWSPRDFLKSLIKITRPGGHILISTLCIDGFDLQILWENSSQISPPHHLNFISLKGFEDLFIDVGLEGIEISTPGRLDVDIVSNALLKNNDLLENNRYIDKLLQDKNLSKSFQKFIMKNNLSSHAWIIARKPG